MNRKKVVLVGGGSNAWAPNLVKDMLLTEPLGDAEFVLYDTNLAASDLVKAWLENLNRGLRQPCIFRSTNRRAKALDGADYVLITISTGGLDAMAHDLAIPEEFGIYHTVGDTSGPGGWARLLRNFPVFKDLAEAINRYAGAAMVLNYTNPMTTLTAVLSRLCQGPVVGLCHGLFENLDFLKRTYHLANEDDVSVSYAGLNHFFWITQARTRDTDIIADLRQRLTRQSFTDLLRESSPDPMGFRSNRELATELFRTTGVLPYLGDRHTCEFFPCYITSKANLKKYRLVRTSIAERREGFAARQAELLKAVQAPMPTAGLTRSRETAADIIAAHVQGKPFIDVGNLPNRGQVANLPLGTVVETAVRVDRNGFSPIAFGPLPEPVRSFVEPYARVFDLAVEACFRGDRALALQALQLDPVCAHLNPHQARNLGERLLAAHASFVTM
jgi:alpha-galactosidase/6-phospho-beta-glucosidase family protein